MTGTPRLRRRLWGRAAVVVLVTVPACGWDEREAVSGEPPPPVVKLSAVSCPPAPPPAGDQPAVLQSAAPVPPQVAWQSASLRLPWLAIGDGIVAAGNESAVHWFDTTSGQRLGGYSVEENGVTSNGAVVDGKVVVGTATFAYDTSGNRSASVGRLRALSPDGQAWMTPARDGEAWTVVAGDEAVYATWSGDVRAFDAADGHELWAAPGGGVVAAPDLAVVVDGCGLWGVEPRTGRERWAAGVPGAEVTAGNMLSQAVVAGDVVVAASFVGGPNDDRSHVVLTGISLATGEVRWTWSSPAVESQIGVGVAMAATRGVVAVAVPARIASQGPAALDVHLVDTTAGTGRWSGRLAAPALTAHVTVMTACGERICVLNAPHLTALGADGQAAPPIDLGAIAGMDSIIDAVASGETAIVAGQGRVMAVALE
jgi:hypothetical protein